MQLDAEGSETVGDLKIKIQEAQGHAVDHQKLIYSGAFAVAPYICNFSILISCASNRQSPPRFEDGGIMRD